MSQTTIIAESISARSHSRASALNHVMHPLNSHVAVIATVKRLTQKKQYSISNTDILSGLVLISCWGAMMFLLGAVQVATLFPCK